MNNDRELLEALLAGKILQHVIGTHTFTYALVEGTLESKRDGLLCERCLLDIEARLWTIKPKTILINGIEVPAPERLVLESNTKYYIPYFEYFLHDSIKAYRWSDDEVDILRLSKGLVHLTRENAIAHAKALLSFTSTEK